MVFFYGPILVAVGIKRQFMAVGLWRCNYFFSLLIVVRFQGIAAPKVLNEG